jgi:hypothetical protein
MISVYNIDKKELVGIFASTSIAGYYVFGMFEGKVTDRIRKGVTEKTRIFNSRFDFPIAVRYSTNRHLELLGQNHGVVFEGYPSASTINIGGIKYTNFVNEKSHESLS